MCQMMDYDLNKQQPISSRTAAREAFFLDFSREARKRYPNVVLMLTGGFRTRQGAEAAVKENACDLIGIGRPACVDPKIAHLILDDGVKDEDAQLSLKKAPVPLFLRLLPLRVQNAGAETVSHSLDCNLIVYFSRQRLMRRTFSYTTWLRSNVWPRDWQHTHLQSKFMCESKE